MNCRERATMCFLGSHCPNCDAGLEYCDETDSRTTETRYARHQAQLAVFSTSYGSREAEPDVKLKYEFIVHQTDKAILFAFKGEHGVYQQWIPRSVIAAQTDKHVLVKPWFARRFV